MLMSFQGVNNTAIWSNCIGVNPCFKAESKQGVLNVS